MLLVLAGTNSIFSQTQKEWRDSLSVLNRQIMSSEYSSDLYLRKAAVNLELEQWDYAIETYTDILKREPANPAALFYRAYANGKMRRYELAENDYRNFLKVLPRMSMVCLPWHIYASNGETTRRLWTTTTESLNYFPTIVWLTLHGHLWKPQRNSMTLP